MNNQPKKLLIWGTIAVLVILNVFRWWPSSVGPRDVNSSESTAFRLEDFQINALPVGGHTSFRRDIFHPNRIVVASKPIAKPVSAEVAVSPTKSPEELARESAQAMYAQIHCVGISAREKSVHAYMVNAGDAVLVSVGDKVAGRFVVEKILSDGVVLHDPDTGVGGKVKLSGS